MLKPMLKCNFFEAIILMSKFVIFCVFLSSYSFEHIVIDDFLPKKEDLTGSLIRYYRTIKNYALLEKREKDRGILFNLLPILGFDFIISKPLLYLNTKAATNQFAKSHDGLSEVNSVKIDFLDGISELERLYDDIVDEIEVYNEYIEVYLYRCELKKIKEGEYSKYLITPTEYYTFLEHFKEKEHELAQHLLKIKRMKNNLISFSRIKSHCYESII